MTYEVGDSATGTVVAVLRFGIFLDLEDGGEGFVDAAAMSEPWLPIPAVETWPRVGEVMTGRVVHVDDRRTRLSIRPSDLRRLGRG